MVLKAEPHAPYLRELMRRDARGISCRQPLSADQFGPKTQIVAGSSGYRPRALNPRQPGS